MKKRMYIGVLLGYMFLLYGCSFSGDKIPDTVPDIITMLYTNMTELDSYSAESTLTMDMILSGAQSDMKIVTEVGMQKKPLELTVVHKSQMEQTETTSYLYGQGSESGMDVYYYENNQWTKEVLDQTSAQSILEQYSSPVDFNLYFADTDTFEIAAQTEEFTLLKGTVAKENVIKTLKDTGVLQQLSLTSISQEMLNNIEPIVVEVKVNNKTVGLEQFVLDMTATYQSLCELIFTEETKVDPKINKCTIVMEKFRANEALGISIPENVKSELEKMK